MTPARLSWTNAWIPNVENLDINYAESCILTPCDFPFARDGIAAICDANTEGIAFADLQIDTSDQPSIWKRSKP